MGDVDGKHGLEKIAKRVERLTDAQVKHAKPKDAGSPRLHADGAGCS